MHRGEGNIRFALEFRFICFSLPHFGYHTRTRIVTLGVSAENQPVCACAFLRLSSTPGMYDRSTADGVAVECFVAWVSVSLQSNGFVRRSGARFLRARSLGARFSQELDARNSTVGARRSGLDARGSHPNTFPLFRVLFSVDMGLTGLYIY